VILARQGLAFVAWLFVVAKQVIELVARVLEVTRLDITAVSSLFHGSAPGKVVSAIGDPV
jgi:hypothetical protein